MVAPPQTLGGQRGRKERCFLSQFAPSHCPPDAAELLANGWAPAPLGRILKKQLGERVRSCITEFGHPNGRHPPRPRASTSQRLQLRHGSVMRVRCRIPPDRSRVESSHDPALGRAAAVLLGPCGLLPISRSATTRLKSLLFYSSRYNALAQELASWSGIVGTWRSALCRAAWNAMAVWLSRNRIAILSCGLNGVSTRSILIFIPSPARNKHHHRMRLDSIGWS